MSVRFLYFESTSCRRLSNVKKALRGGVVSVVRYLCAPISSCTTRSTKGFEIEFRALLNDGAQEEERFERVAVGST